MAAVIRARSAHTGRTFPDYERRTGSDRRQFAYSFYLPERRVGNDRRNGNALPEADTPIGLGAMASPKEGLKPSEKRTPV